MEGDNSLWPTLTFDPTPINLDKHNEKHRRVFIPDCYNNINSPLIELSNFETFIGPLNKLFFQGLVNTEEDENDKRIGYNPMSELSDRLKKYNDEEKQVMKIELLKLWYNLAGKRIEKGGEEYNISEYQELERLVKSGNDSDLLNFFSKWFTSTNTNKIFCATTQEKKSLIDNITSNKELYFSYITKDKEKYLEELKEKKLVNTDVKEVTDEIYADVLIAQINKLNTQCTPFVRLDGDGIIVPIEAFRFDTLVKAPFVPTGVWTDIIASCFFISSLENGKEYIKQYRTGGKSKNDHELLKLTINKDFKYNGNIYHIHDGELDDVMSFRYIAEHISENASYNIITCHGYEKIKEINTSKLLDKYIEVLNRGRKPSNVNILNLPEMKLDNCNIQQYYIQFVKLYNIDNFKEIGEKANDLLHMEKEKRRIRDYKGPTARIGISRGGKKRIRQTKRRTHTKRRPTKKRRSTKRRRAGKSSRTR